MDKAIESLAKAIDESGALLSPTTIDTNKKGTKKCLYLSLLSGSNQRPTDYKSFRRMNYSTDNQSVRNISIPYTTLNRLYYVNFYYRHQMKYYGKHK